MAVLELGQLKLSSPHDLQEETVAEEEGHDFQAGDSTVLYWVELILNGCVCVGVDVWCA